MAALRKFGVDIHGRQVFFLPLARLEDCPNHLDLPSSHFGVLLLCDARAIHNNVIFKIARSLLQNGLVWLAVWGPDCKRVHDLFDAAAQESDPSPTTSSVIMTTWEEDESLDEVLWFNLNVPFAADGYIATCKASLVISVGDDQWTELVAKRLADPEALASDVLKDKV